MLRDFGRNRVKSGSTEEPSPCRKNTSIPLRSLSPVCVCRDITTTGGKWRKLTASSLRGFVTHRSPHDVIYESVPIRRWPWFLAGAIIIISYGLSVVAAVVFASPVMAAVWCIGGLFFTWSAILTNVIGVIVEPDALKIRWLGRNKRIPWAHLRGIEVLRAGRTGPVTGMVIWTRTGERVTTLRPPWLGCPTERAAEIIRDAQLRFAPAQADVPPERVPCK
jgi:hypothetical protein